MTMQRFSLALAREKVRILIKTVVGDRCSSVLEEVKIDNGTYRD